MSGDVAGTAPAELGLVPISTIALARLWPSPENQELYQPVNPDAQDIKDMAKDIAAKGVLDPLVVTADYVIISGHRRYAAAKLAGLDSAPCRVLPRRKDDYTSDEFVALLRAHNRQRIKSFDELVREQAVDYDPDEAHEVLLEHRRRQGRPVASNIDLGVARDRARITTAKLPLLNAAIGVLNANREFWPLTVRQIHYRLLNAPPPIHASKPKLYSNDRASYKALCELLTRARLAGNIPFHCITDETRPITLGAGFPNVQVFVQEEIDDFLKRYCRNYQISQPHHIEIYAEKLTIDSIIRPVAGEYCIPYTIGRGYCSIQPRHELAQRYRKSGKDKLVLLVLSDHDPDGETIASSFARSLRDEFDIKDIKAVKVALTGEQVGRFALPCKLEAKRSSVHYSKFAGQHGRFAYELEALTPLQLQGLLRDAILSVTDIKALNRERALERDEAVKLASLRDRVKAVLACETNHEGHGG